MRLADAVRRQLKGMNPVERENAVRELREVLYGDAYETIITRDDDLACPRCGSVAIVKKVITRTAPSVGSAGTASARSRTPVTR